MNYKTDGSEWYNYFHIRKYNEGVFYIAWNGTTESAFPGQDWKEYWYAKAWISEVADWRNAVNERFEKEFLKQE